MPNDVPKPYPSETEEDSSSSDGDDEDHDDLDNPVESLVSGRAKRVTAGNRLSSLLEQEGGDDELELLFAEDEEEDVEFEGDGGEDASDVELGSSSDEEDKGPAQGDDDLEGERELQKQKRVGQKRKRDAQAVFKRPVLRNKVVPDPTATAEAPTTPLARTRKKSERVSWIPTPEDGPTRQSTRKQTVHNKEVIHLRMMESEKRRVQLIAVMEAAAKRRKTPKVMTQEERLEEAARTERRNAKSLNRWEESEKKRMDDQKAKLEALQNRQLNGPVICSCSSKARWVNGKIEKTGVKDLQESMEKRKPMENEGDKMDVSEGPVENQPAKFSHNHNPSTPQTTQPPLDVLEPGSSTSLPGPEAQLLQHKDRPQLLNQTPLMEYSARNLIILKNIDTNAMKLPELHNHVLLRKRVGKLQSKFFLAQGWSDLSLNGRVEPFHSVCAITGQAAKYRDPTTGLAYLDSYAYKEIQRLRQGGSRWSSLLGCYVGAVDSFARGVPDRFWMIAEHRDET